MCSLILPENAIDLKLNSRNLSERFGSTRWFRFFACSPWLTLMVRERILVGSVMTFNARIYLFWKQHQELRRKALWIQRTIPWRVSIALCTCWMSWFESIRMFGFISATNLITFSLQSVCNHHHTLCDRLGSKQYREIHPPGITIGQVYSWPMTNGSSGSRFRLWPWKLLSFLQMKLLLFLLW